MNEENTSRSVARTEIKGGYEGVERSCFRSQPNNLDIDSRCFRCLGFAGFQLVNLPGQNGDHLL
jgi:hypothetical protein